MLNKKRRFRRFAAMLPVLTLVTLCACGGASVPADENRTQAGSPAAARAEATEAAEAAQTYSCMTLDGGDFSSEEFAKYDLTVINVWGTYCGPCIREMPDLAAFARGLPDNVNFITACIDAFQARSAAERIVGEANLTSPVLISFEGGVLDLVNSSQYIPSTFFVDSNGQPVGDPIVGGTNDVQGVFTAAVNQRLTELGKAPIS